MCGVTYTRARAPCPRTAGSSCTEAQVKQKPRDLSASSLPLRWAARMPVAAILMLVEPIHSPSRYSLGSHHSGVPQKWGPMPQHLPQDCSLCTLSQGQGPGLAYLEMHSAQPWAWHRNYKCSVKSEVYAFCICSKTFLKSFHRSPGIKYAVKEGENLPPKTSLNL